MPPSAAPLTRAFVLKLPAEKMHKCNNSNRPQPRPDALCRLIKCSGLKQREKKAAKKLQYAFGQGKQRGHQGARCGGARAWLPVWLVSVRGCQSALASLCACYIKKFSSWGKTSKSSCSRSSSSTIGIQKPTDSWRGHGRERHQTWRVEGKCS